MHWYNFFQFCQIIIDISIVAVTVNKEKVKQIKRLTWFQLTWKFGGFIRGEHCGEAIDAVLVTVKTRSLSFFLIVFHREQVWVVGVFYLMQRFFSIVSTKLHYVDLSSFKLSILIIYSYTRSSKLLRLTTKKETAKLTFFSAQEANRGRRKRANRKILILFMVGNYISCYCGDEYLYLHKVYLKNSTNSKRSPFHRVGYR